MSIFRTFLIVLLAIALIEALPATKPTSKPSSYSITKLRSLSSKSLVAEEKMIGARKASKISVENAEQPKEAERKKKSTTFCVEIRPEPTDKVCDPTPGTVIHEHHQHPPINVIVPHIPVNPDPPSNPPSPINPPPQPTPPTNQNPCNVGPPIYPRPEPSPDFPGTFFEPQPQPPINIPPSPLVPPTTVVLQPQPTLGCITSSYGPCPPSLYPSIYPSNSLPPSSATKNLYYVGDSLLRATNDEESISPIEKPQSPIAPNPHSQSVVMENPETPANARTVEQKYGYAIPSPVQQAYQTINNPQNYRQQQNTEPCGSGFAPSTFPGFAGATKNPALPSGPVIPPPINTDPSREGPRMYMPSSAMQSLLSDLASFRMMPNSPNSGASSSSSSSGYQTLFRSYDPNQGSAGVPISVGQNSNTQQIRLQRQQTEEPKNKEKEEKITSTPESPIFGGLMNKMRASKEMWSRDSSMQNFPQEKIDQIQQLRTQAAQVNANSSANPSDSNENQSVLSNQKKMRQNEIETVLKGGEGKRP